MKSRSACACVRPRPNTPDTDGLIADQIPSSFQEMTVYTMVE